MATILFRARDCLLAVGAREGELSHIRPFFPNCVRSAMVGRRFRPPLTLQTRQFHRPIAVFLQAISSKRRWAPGRRQLSQALLARRNASRASRYSFLRSIQFTAPYMLPA